MKRKLFITLVATVLLVASVFALVACNKNKQNAVESNVSRMTLGYYAGESDLFAVTVEKGKREKNFIADGKATDVEDFAEITILPLKANDYTEIAYELKNDTSTLSGSIKKNEYGEYVERITLDFKPTLAVITVGEEKSEIELASILDGALTAEDVIDIARAEFKEILDKEASEEKCREIYLKVITGDRVDYYYYVSFIGEGVDYLAVLIDPKTGKVVSKK